MRVVVLDDYQGVAASYADWASLDADVEFCSEPLAGAALTETLAGAEVVVAMRERTPFPSDVLERLPDLRLLVTTGMANASIDLEAARARGIVVCGTESPASATPELAWGLILSVLRSIPVEDANMRAGGWQTTVGGDLDGRRLGIVGLGRLGSRMAAIGRAFGMDVVAWSTNLDAARAAEAGATAVPKEELFATSDVVTIHYKFSARSRGLIGAAELAAMKPSAILVNTSRGPIVDAAALLSPCARGGSAVPASTSTTTSRSPRTIRCARRPAPCSPRTSGMSPRGRIASSIRRPSRTSRRGGRGRRSAC